MVRKILAFALGIIFVCASSVAGSQIRVYGTGNPGIDIDAVQDAVNEFDKVLLFGNFDFGDLGRVVIQRDVQILGETDKKGNPVTMINGGLSTFASPLPAGGAPPSEPGPKITISNIHFHGARYTPIHILYTRGTLISGNKITNVIPVMHPWLPFFVQAGAILGTFYVIGPPLIPGALTGNLIFSGNNVDLSNDHPESTAAQAVFCNLTWGAAIEISDNVVVNVSRNAIESFDNYIDEDGNGSLTISNNNIITPQVGLPVPSPNTPNGIVAGWVLNPLGGMDPTKYSNIFIKHNYIEQQEGGLGYAIIVASSDAVVRQNHIIMGGGENTIGIHLRYPNGVVANNRIAGSGGYALSVGATNPEIIASGNRLHGNNLNHFYPNEGGFHVQFEIDSTNNVLLGGKGTIWDEGTNNVIKGNYEIYP